MKTRASLDNITKMIVGGIILSHLEQDIPPIGSFRGSLKSQGFPQSQLGIGIPIMGSIFCLSGQQEKFTW